MTDAEYARTLLYQGEIATTDKPRYGVARCVRCYKPARLWSGHVVYMDTGQQRKRIAGWCGVRCMRVRGFFGQYHHRMDVE